MGVDHKYSVQPIPSRELTLNKLLKQNPLWVATPNNNEEE